MRVQEKRPRLVALAFVGSKERSALFGWCSSSRCCCRRRCGCCGCRSRRWRVNEGTRISTRCRWRSFRIFFASLTVLGGVRDYLVLVLAQKERINLTSVRCFGSSLSSFGFGLVTRRWQFGESRHSQSAGSQKGQNGFHGGLFDVVMMGLNLRHEPQVRARARKSAAQGSCLP